MSAALLPPEHGGPDPAHVAALVEGHLRQAPPAVRGAFRAGLATLAAVSRITTGRSLLQLPPERRVRLLERLANLGAESAMAVDGLKALVLLAYGADAYADEILTRANQHPVARPDAHMDVTPSRWWPSTMRCDAIVIGSGAGGAFAARTLAEAGLEVVIVEEGRRWSVQEFRTRHPLQRYAELYRDAGTTIALGSPPVVLPIGRGVGGTTLVNSGTCYRPPHDVQRRWRDEFALDLADPESFAEYLDEVERTLQVAPVPLEVMGRNGRTLLAGAEKLGWDAAPIPRNAPGCEGCCQCAIGCPQNAKFGVHLNALPQACAHGARILSEAKVLRVLHEAGRATGVLARRPDGSKVTLSAPIVVVAAGATETPPLLGRSGLGSHPELGKNLSIHPALAAAGRFDEDVYAWRGVLQSAAVKEWHESEGILIEATSTPPGMGSMTLPGFGSPLLRELAEAHHLAALGAMIGDRSSGRVYGKRGMTVIRYDLHRDDARRLVSALRHMGHVLFAAGAREVRTGIPGFAIPTSVDELDRQLDNLRPRNLHLAAFHPTGTARAGGDAQRCPVDQDGRLRGVDGVWVADASIVPSCPEVNPQVSIMAMSLAVADRIVATHSP